MRGVRRKIQFSCDVSPCPVTTYVAAPARRRKPLHHNHLGKKERGAEAPLARGPDGAGSGAHQLVELDGLVGHLGLGEHEVGDVLLDDHGKMLESCSTSNCLPFR